VDHSPSESDDTSAVRTVNFGPMSFAIVRLARAHRALATQLMREVGLGAEQGALMMHLWSEGPVRQTALSAHFGRDSASTTRTVQRLEHAGYVRRRRDPRDGRATLVEPTPAGNALRVHVEKLWERLEAVVDGALTDSEKAHALPLIVRLGDVVSEALTAEFAKTLTEV
jgi:DNA-binding MarR family transcriptional regulator